ncbi:hypothetical protein GCM10011583_07810 [Streptomyces camponoticapitis]|uniref:DUF5709 domain-containing protein n=1 Tax=Streptomyces camponoticapitis TaxID=1616125 RepID=A0ABQ2DYP3_9ACTN|nr:DUF5709 domain-containing protein [Streptomyces camponoticapitis]GGJ78670.1 hypothetical protein GCM10011583_07810 [Streptomyces camponoticapitis]
MADESRGDDVYQPENSDVQNGPSDDLDLENVIGERGLDDMMTEGYSPPERPLGVNKYGVTGEEQQEGETLEQRLAQEAPDVRPEAGDDVGDVPDGEGEPRDTETGEERAGRLQPVDDIAPRRNSHVSARDVGIDGGAASAEEAAMHISPDEEDEA